MVVAAQTAAVGLPPARPSAAQGLLALLSLRSRTRVPRRACLRTPEPPSRGVQAAASSWRVGTCTWMAGAVG